MGRVQSGSVPLTFKNPLDFRGRIALVTGAASGMGLATAKAFAEAGAAVVMTDFREAMVKSEADRIADDAGAFWHSDAM